MILSKNSVLSAFDFKEKPTYQLEANSNHSYFIENIFKKSITALKQHQPSHLLHPGYLYALLTIALIVGASCIIGYKNHHKNVAVFNKIKHSLQQTASTAFDSLAIVIRKLDRTSQSWWFKLGINEIKSPINALYKKSQNLFLQTITRLYNLVITR